MQENFSTTLGGGAVAEVGGGSTWTNKSNVLVDDANAAQGASGPGPGTDSTDLLISDFGFDLPDFAVIDGIEVAVDQSMYVSGAATCYLTLPTGGPLDADPMANWTVSRDVITNGGTSDLWEKSDWTPADINDSDFGVGVNYMNGSGFENIYVYYVSITVHWHVSLATPPAEVPTRVDYKMFNRDGVYLGLLPNPGRLAFSQEISSAGSSMVIKCGVRTDNVTTTSPLLTEDDDEILTEDDEVILAQETEVVVAPGDSEDDILFKNSNRVQAWLYNNWHPNGKLMFSGQVNRTSFQYGGDVGVEMLVFSDGLDLNNFIARGYPFAYTNDVSQTAQNGYVTVSAPSKGASFISYGQTWLAGGSADNTGSIRLRILGTATVTVSVYEGPNQSLIGSISKAVAVGAATNIDFDFSQLLDTAVSTEYFFTVKVNPGKSIRLYRNSTSVYANGTMYSVNYGGAGPVEYVATTGDLYFVTKYGVPTTTTTFTADDPVTGMMTDILLDYNSRGGYITERNFEATGLSLTYTFNIATVYDAMKKVIELAPTDYYGYVDLGTAEMDILSTPDTPDYTVVRGRDVNKLNIDMSIEQVKNYLLQTGGEVSPGVNLYKSYQDSESAALYGLRTAARTDNRVILAATSDAIGQTFIEEESEEIHETSLTVLNETMDITQLVPGKTVGFKNFDNFIDNLVLQIVRRDYTVETVTLTLGRLPITMNAQIQKINRGLLNEQTVNNPSAPS